MGVSSADLGWPVFFFVITLSAAAAARAAVPLEVAAAEEAEEAACTTGVSSVFVTAFASDMTMIAFAWEYLVYKLEHSVRASNKGLKRKIRESGNKWTVQYVLCPVL